MSLDQIALRHGTDKSSAQHNYCPIYERYFQHIRNSPLVLLELGVGGYDRPDIGGHSLRTWAEYFPQGRIYGIDIHDKEFLNNDRIKTFMCSQDDPIRLREILNEIHSPDIIIDDASHISPLTIKAFNILFPSLKSGGIYVIEDVHTSYWSTHGFHGGTHPDTTMNYFKGLADSLMPEHSGKESTFPILSIQFWDRIIFILKKVTIYLFNPTI